MKLKYKISISIFLISLAIVSFISYFYSQYSYKNTIKNEKVKLTTSAIETARYIELELLDKLSNTLTISSAPIVSKSLTKSNKEYKNLSDKQINKKISKLNKKWMDTDNIDDEFIKPYLNNDLALFLKKQQSILKGVYGELFITNLHGAMIATTGKLTTLAHSQKYWWKKSFNSGDGAVFFDDRGFDDSVDGYVIGVVVPIKVDGKVIGILKANVNIMQALNTVVNHYNSTNQGSLKIVRTKGLVVYEKGVTPLSSNINFSILKNLANMQSGARIVKNNNSENLISYAPVRISIDNKNIGFGGKVKTIDHIKGNDREIWHTVISYPKELALAESTQTNKMIIYIGLFIAFLSVIVAFFTGRWISKPIDDLQIAHLKLQEQEEIMIAQSRHAAMGEMISMIAHQWRQPLGAIAMSVNNILADIELETVDEKEFKETSNDILKKIQELSKTIDNFKDFFKPQKEMNEVFIRDVLKDACDIIGKSLQNNDIEVIKDFKDIKKIKTYSRELMQVFINLLKNSQEAFVENDAKEKKIWVTTEDVKESVVIKICDNANEINLDFIDKIFDPYFSTKDEKNGAGLGLYMSKTIIDKHLKGYIKAYNIDNGVCFEIGLPLNIKESRRYE